MRIENICIDRFGRRENMTLSGLAEEVTVIYGPNGSGKSTVIQFLRWVLFGRPDEHVDSYLREAIGQASGRLNVHQHGQRHEIGRRDDGTRHGQWFLDGHLQPEPATQVAPLTGNLTARDFDLFFSPCFEVEPDLVGLLQSARSRGLELTTRRQPTQGVQELRIRIDSLRRELERLPWVGHELAHLRDHRASLERRARQFEDDTRRRHDSVDREYDELNRHIVDLENSINRLRDDWHAKDRDVGVRRADLEEAWRTAEQARQDFTRQRRNQLAELESNLEHARGMLADIQRRTTRLADELRGRELDASLGIAERDATLCHVQTLAKQLDAVSGVASAVPETPVFRSQHGYRATVVTNSATLDALRTEIGHLCRVLQQDKECDKLHSMAVEQAQLHRCEEEIARWTNRLVTQRDLIAKEVDEAERFGISLVFDDLPDVTTDAYVHTLPEIPARTRRVRAVLHSCDGFEPIEPESDEILRRLVSAREVVQRDLDTVERQLRQLLDRRRELEFTLNRVQNHEVDALRREIAEVDAKLRSAEERERIRREIERLEMELVRVGDDLVPSPIVSHAAELLSDLTAGRYVGIRVKDGAFVDGASVLIQEATGTMIPFGQLSRGLRDQVYLSLCLAMIAMLKQQGIEMPLLLNDAFINIDSNRDQAMAATLSKFSRFGHQLVLFTRHRHVAELFRPYDARLIELGPVLESQPTKSQVTPGVDEVRFRAYAETPATAPQRISERGVVTYRRLRDRDVSEFRPLPRRGPLDRGVAYDRAPQLGERANILPGHLPLEQSQVMDITSARQLNQLGIVTVDDFLRSSPDFVARESQRRGLPVPVAQQRWRDELSLRCTISGLDAHQAHVLVHAGITSVESLAVQSVDTLASRLESTTLMPADAAPTWETSIVGDRRRLASWIHEARHLGARYRSTDDARQPREYAWEKYEDYALPATTVTYRSASLGGSATRPTSTQVTAAGNVPTLPPNASSAGRNGPIVAELAPAAVRDYDDSGRGSASTLGRVSDLGNSSRRPRPTGSAGGQGTSTASGSSRSTIRSTRRRDRGSSGRPSDKPDSIGGADEALRFYLGRGDSLVDAPSIGPRTADKFRAIGVATVGAFLQATATDLAARLADGRISAKSIAEWQAQTALACRIPDLRGHDAQILVACGVADPAVLAAMTPDDLWSRVRPFSRSPEGKRIIRGGKAPNLAEVTDWIRWAHSARPLEDA